jgi:hypothetical protein
MEYQSISLFLSICELQNEGFLVSHQLLSREQFLLQGVIVVLQLRYPQFAVS